MQQSIHAFVAAPSNVERLTGADHNNFHGDACLHRKERQQMVEQTRILRRSGRSYDNRFILGCCIAHRPNHNGKGRDAPECKFADQIKAPSISR
jgi:hypothetical protein